MKFLPEVCIQPRNNRLDFGDNLDYDSDLADLHVAFIKSDGSDFRLINFARGLQLLTNCPVLILDLASQA